MLKKRTLALLLSLAMLLTFMPAMAFAEDADDAADQPAVTDTVEEEAVVEEASEEAVQQEALGAEAEVKSLEFKPAAGFDFNAVEGEDWLDYRYPGNSFEVGYSDNTTRKYICVEHDSVNEDGEPDPDFLFFLDGDESKEEGWFGYQINGSEDGKFVAGNNTVRFEFEGVYTDPITVKAAPKATAIAFTPASDFVFEAMEGDEWVDRYSVGNKLTIKYSDNSTKEYICKQHDVTYSDGDTDKVLDYFENGDTTKEPFEDYSFEIVAPEDGVIKVGDGNRVRFGVDGVYSEEFTVTGVMAPIDCEFIPVSGVSLWGFEEAGYIDGNEFYAEGNKFIVTYSDNKTKKTFVCKDAPFEINGETRNYVGYFEEGIEPVYADGDFNDTSFMTDIPESGLARGNNAVRFKMNRSGDSGWSSKTYNVTGKPYAVNITFNPNVFSATIYPEFDDIDFWKAGNQIVVKYNDGTTKTFKPAEVKNPDGGTYTVFMSGNEEINFDWPETRLKEGKNTVPVTFWNVADDEIIVNVTVNASKPGVCTKHQLHSVKAVKATCQSQGVKAHYECSVCHKLFTDKKGKKEVKFEKLLTKKAKHVFKKKIVSDEYLKSAATCTKKATYYYACKTCGEKGKKTFTSGKALGHDFVAGNITKATAKKDGKIASKCSRCGKTNKGVKIPKVSKVFSLNKKSIKYIGEGKEKDAISLKIKAGKYPVTSEEYDVDYSEPVYGKKGKGSGTVTVTFKPECKYYSGSIKLTYKITKVPKN